MLYLTKLYALNVNPVSAVDLVYSLSYLISTGERMRIRKLKK